MPSGIGPIATIAAALALLLLQTGLACAADTKAIVKADNKADFSAVVAAVQKEMAPGGRFEFTDAAGRQTIQAKLADMQSIFDKFDTVANMQQDVKVQLFNDQEAVNAILTRHDDKRLVCERIAPVGSNIPRTTCRTYREVQMQRLGTQQYLDRIKAQTPNNSPIH